MNTTKMLQGGVRRRRNKAPVSSGSGDRTVIKYSSIGDTQSSTAGGLLVGNRVYIPGRAGGLANSVGPSLVAYYSSAKFLPGTKLRWEPSVPFTTSGRIYVGFTDNPEVISALWASSGITFVERVKGLGSVISFPVWQETEVPFPTTLRRKRFDVNAYADVTDNNITDRCAQTAVFIAGEGITPSTTCGHLWFHDVVDCEGVQSYVP